VTLLKLPGLIDPHVHLRDPGAAHKEDYDSGTAAALAGGFTCVLDMPNNTPPVTDGPTLAAKQQAARARARCDYGIHFGAGADNVESAPQFARQCSGLKMYLDQTFGPLRLDELGTLMGHAEHWPHDAPLLCHAEGRTVAAAILAANLFDRNVVYIGHEETRRLLRATIDWFEGQGKKRILDDDLSAQWPAAARSPSHSGTGHAARCRA